MKRSMTVTMSPEIDDMLTMMACARGISKGELMRRAFYLMKAGYDEAQKCDGSSLGFVKRLPDNTLKATGVVKGL